MLLHEGSKSRFLTVHVVQIVLCIYDMYALLQRATPFAESYSLKLISESHSLFPSSIIPLSP